MSPWRSWTNVAPESSVALNAWSPRSSRLTTVWPASFAASDDRVTESSAPVGKQVMVA